MVRRYAGKSRMSNVITVITFIECPSSYCVLSHAFARRDVSVLCCVRSCNCMLYAPISFRFVKCYNARRLLPVPFYRFLMGTFCNGSRRSIPLPNGPLHSFPDHKSALRKARKLEPWIQTYQWLLQAESKYFKTRFAKNSLFGRPPNI